MTNAYAITEQEAHDIAVDAYVYFYPIVSLDVTRKQFTNLEPGKVPGRGPMNMFNNVPTYPPGDDKGVVRYNFDTLYSTAFLDLTKEPMVVSVPDTGGRYYLLPMLDMWTDVFASPGWRTTGTQAGEYLIAPAAWRPDLRERFDEFRLPAGTQRIRAFYDRWYRPNATILVLVGDVKTADAVKQLEGAFGDWAGRPDAIADRAGAPAPITERRVLLVDKPDATQTQIRVGAPSMARNDPELLAGQVGNTILGGGFTSKLIEELRVKRSLTYGASSAFVARKVGGDFRLSTFTKTPTTLETLKLALEVENGFREKPIDPKLIDKAKRYLNGQFPLRVETPDAIAMRLAEIEFNGLPADDLSTYRTRIDAVTPAAASRVAKDKMFDVNRVAITVVGKASEIKGPLEQAYGPVKVVTPLECDTLGRK